MRPCYFFLLIALLTAPSCKDPEGKINIVPLPAAQQSPVYSTLSSLFGPTLADTAKSDTLSILVLPIDITCPTCRKKILLSLMKNKEHIKPNHFIIISGNGGKKYIDGYFQEHQLRLPTGLKQLALDTAGLMKNNALYEGEPVIYYGIGQKILSKSKVSPGNVKKQLELFF